MRDDSVRATCVDTDSITLASNLPARPCQPMETALLLVQLDTGENLQGLAPYGEQTPVTADPAHSNWCLFCDKVSG